jgi:hypothetical protein
VSRLTNEQVKVEFLRRVNVTDHPYSRIGPSSCCRAPIDRHLGYGGLPWTLPPVSEMRELLRAADPSGDAEARR